MTIMRVQSILMYLDEVISTRNPVRELLSDPCAHDGVQEHSGELQEADGVDGKGIKPHRQCQRCAGLSLVVVTSVCVFVVMKTRPQPSV